MLGTSQSGLSVMLVLFPLFPNIGVGVFGVSQF
jgi:hypothetical protein